MYLVELDAQVDSEGEPFAPDAVTDLIERLVDALDAEGFEADVSTEVVGLTFKVVVGVPVDEPSEMQALHTAISGIASAFAAIGTEPTGILRMAGLSSSVRGLVPA